MYVYKVTVSAEFDSTGIRWLSAMKVPITALMWIENLVQLRQVSNLIMAVVCRV